MLRPVLESTSPERNPQQVLSKVHTDTNHAGKFQGHVMSEPNASIFPLFMCLTCFILSLLLTYSCCWLQATANTTISNHYYTSIVWLNTSTACDESQSCSLPTVFDTWSWYYSSLIINLNGLWNYSRRSGCIQGHSVTNKELQTDFIGPPFPLAVRWRKRWKFKSFKSSHGGSTWATSTVLCLLLGSRVAFAL